MAPIAWYVVVRDGPRVERHRAATLEAALDVLEDRVRTLAPHTRRRRIDARVRAWEPGDQVALRAELRAGRAPWARVHGGLDVRGDGAVRAWTGGAERADVEEALEETPNAAQRRALGAGGSASVAP